MATKELSVRLSLDGAPRVIRDMTAAGAAGDKSLHRIAAAAAPASRALQTVSSVASELRGRLAGIGEGLASRLGAIGSVMGALGPAGLAAAAGIGAVAVGAAGFAAVTSRFVSGVVDTSKEFEKFGAILKTTEGSAVGAQKALGWVANFAQTTPYEVAEVTEAFVKLRAYGMDPTHKTAKDGTTLLKTLGNTAAAMGKPLSQAVEAIADAVTGENERLKEFGIKASKQGQEITYSYTAAGKQMTATANINSRAMIEATLAGIWNKKYAGAMDELSKTWAGITSNISDAWTGFQVKVGNAGVFESLKGILGRVLGYINELSSGGALDRIAKTIGEPLTMAFNAAGRAIDDFVASQGGIQAFATTVEGYIGRFAGSLTGGATSVTEFAGIIREKVGDAWQGFSDLATVVGAVASAIRGLVEIAQTAGSALNSVNAAVTGAGNWVYRNVTAPITGGNAMAAVNSAGDWVHRNVTAPIANMVAPAIAPAAPAGGAGSFAAPAPALGPAVQSARPQQSPPFGPYAARQQQVGVGGAIEINIKSQQPVEARATKQSGPVKLNVNQGLALGMP